MSCWLRDKHTCSHSGSCMPASHQICRNLICHMFLLQCEQVEQRMVWTTRHAGRWIQNLQSQSRGIGPEATAVTRLRLLNAAAFVGSSSSTDSFFWHGTAFDVGKAWVLRVATIRLGFQAELEYEERMKQLYLSSVSLLILKKCLNEQVELTSPRIYEQAPNPAPCHGGGPVGSVGNWFFRSVAKSRFL